jgi:hypothetical protein
MPKEVEFLFCSQYKVNARYCGNFVRLELSVAAHNDHKRLRRMAKGSSDYLPTLPISTFRDTARVDDADIGRLIDIHDLIAALDELAPQR